MKERPILFSGAMVRAILEGWKTQTRRVVKIPEDPMLRAATLNTLRGYGGRLTCPYGQTGDRLWVRENHQLQDVSPHGWPQCLVGYRDGTTLIVDPADDECPRLLAEDEAGLKIDHNRWRRSIHMPRWASRINLEVTGVRVERLNDISEADAIAEGIRSAWPIVGEPKTYYDYIAKINDPCEWYSSPIRSYQSLWESINGSGSWDQNPWVWVVEFKRI